MGKKKNLFSKDIKALEKIEKPIVNFSEKYCENIDFKTVIKTIPIIGGYLDNLFAYKGSKIIQGRVNKFFEDISNTLKQLDETKIDKEYLDKNDEFFHIFQKIYEQVIRCNEQEKITLFRNILVNSITLDKSGVYYKERFVNIVSELSLMHIKILKYYFERENIFQKEGRQDTQGITSLESVCQQTGLAESQAEAFCNDLLRYDLLYDFLIGRIGYRRNCFRITNPAKDFLNFILFE